MEESGGFSGGGGRTSARTQEQERGSWELCGVSANESKALYL